MAAPIDITSRLVNSGIEVAASYISAKLAAGANLPKKDPVEALKSLEIDAELATTLTPLFEQAGFHILSDEVLDPAGASRKLTIARNGGSSFYVVSVDRSILSEFTVATFSAFSMLFYVFRENSRVQIISRDLDVPDLGFRPILEQWEQFKKISAAVIPWSYIAAMLRENDLKVRYQKFQFIFKLQASNAKPRPQPAEAIDEWEREDILRILSAYASKPFSDPRNAIQGLVLGADFPEAATFQASWSGDINLECLRLLKFVKDDHPTYPANHSRRGQSRLGWLLKVLHDQEIASEDKVILARIVVDHVLLSDPNTMASLKNEASDPTVPRRQL